MEIKMIDNMYGREGSKVRLLVDGKEIKRRVYYRSWCGLFVLVGGMMVFDYDFYDKDVLILGDKTEEISR